MKALHVFLVLILCQTNICLSFAQTPSDDGWVFIEGDKANQIGDQLTEDLRPKAQYIVETLGVKGKAFDLRAGYPQFNEKKRQLALYSIVIWANNNSAGGGAADVGYVWDLDSEKCINISVYLEMDLSEADLVHWSKDPDFQGFIIRDFLSYKLSRGMLKFEDYVAREASKDNSLKNTTAELPTVEASKPKQTKVFFSEKTKDTLTQGAISVGFAVLTKMIFKALDQEAPNTGNSK